MNPSFNVEVVHAARAQDAESAAAEYFSEFRTDVSSFLADSDIEAAIDRGIRSRPMSLQFHYVAAVDMSGGRGNGSALAIAHLERESVVVDRVEVIDAPHDPAVVVQRFAEILSSYALGRVCGDAYAGEWVPTAFAAHRIAYSTASMSKSDIFLETLPLFTTGFISLPDHSKLEGELRQLERRPRSGGKDGVDHPRGGHDDAATAVLMAAYFATKQGRGQRDENAGNITHALRDYDVVAEHPAERAPPRHLPPGFAGGRYESDYCASLRDHDPFS